MTKAKLSDYARSLLVEHYFNGNIDEPFAKIKGSVGVKILHTSRDYVEIAFVLTHNEEILLETESYSLLAEDKAIVLDWKVEHPLMVRFE